ncbi:MAG TPA: glucose-6-phosphate isomerase family protein [Cellulomonas sp.]|nr:glucose-6-phosphate isomerase family protein [Cellulomonas sp.]
MRDVAQIVEPPSLVVAAADGRLLGSGDRYEKKLKDLAGLYRDTAAFDQELADRADESVYWVESSAPETGDGALTIGLSVLEPGRIGEEFAMTRGHIHAQSQHAELYYGISGTGVMLLDTVDGESRAVPISAGVVVHVPGYWIHRSVNVGNDRLVTLFAYATTAGQDYGIIERAGGMSQLVVADGDDWIARSNPDHRGYVA